MTQFLSYKRCAMRESEPLLPNPKHIQKANKLPLNQEARRWLDLAKSQPDPTTLYTLQLILWGLDPSSEGGKLLKGQSTRRQALENAAIQLLSFPPQKALVFLCETKDPEDEDSNLGKENLSMQRSPRDAAWRAVDALDRILTATLDNYPPKDPPHSARGSRQEMC